MSLVVAVPPVSVEVSGEPLSQEALAHLVGVRVHQTLSLPSLCELRFLEAEDALGSAAAEMLGADLRVRVGHEGRLLFEGDVTAVEYGYEPDAGREIRVRGYDLLHRLRKRQPQRAHVQVSTADLARELVGDLALSVDAGENGPVWQRILQSWQSDWELLLDVMERSGLYFTLRGGVLHILTLEGLGAEVELVLGESLLEARLEVNSESACRAVSASGWDPCLVEGRAGHADRPRLGRSVTAEAPASRVGGEDQRTLVDVAVEDNAQADALAQGKLDLCAATEVVLRGVAEGDVDLAPGARVKVSGIGDPSAGRYVLTEVHHEVDDRSGYVSRLSTAPLPHRRRPRGAIAAFAEVSGVDDPDRLGRVKVTLPAYGGLETEWLGVVTPGAGPDKGLLALPDMGDRVLVLCPRGDPAHGIVVGGLYGTGGPPDETVSGDGVYRYTFTTPGRQRIRLDDAASKIEVETSDGSLLEMGPDEVLLRATAPLTLEAPGQAIRVRGASIDFERA